MRISKSRHLKVNLGNYEHADFGGTVTIDHGDLGYTDEEVQENQSKDPKWLDELVQRMNDRCEQYLDVLLIDDIQSCRDITEEVRSILLRAFTSQGDEPDPPTSRTTSGSADKPTNRSGRRPRRAAR